MIAWRLWHATRAGPGCKLEGLHYDGDREEVLVSSITSPDPPLSTDAVKQIAVPILKLYGAKRASLFGSVVHGRLGPESDIDFLVELPEGASLLDLAGLGLALEQALGRKVDVLTYRSLHPRLRERILAEQVAIL